MRKYNITPEDYKMVEIVIIENKPHKAGPQWKFAGAFYFATVVLAMIGNKLKIKRIKKKIFLIEFFWLMFCFLIGYGHSTPVTIGGKAFCMVYAMIGIPLGLVMFQSIGERLNKFASVVIRRAKKYLKCQKTEATEMNLMLATGMLSSIIITTGAAVFSRYEGWSYFDSFYYCFVTLTTIGFGDYVALQVKIKIWNFHTFLQTASLTKMKLLFSERSSSIKQAWICCFEFGFHPVRFGSGCCQYQFACTQIHDDVSSDTNLNFFFMKKKIYNLTKFN